MVRKLVILGGLGVAVAAAILVGCNYSQPPSENATAPQGGGDPKPGPGKPEEEHGHKPGAHGGILVSLGRDSYHAEAVFARNGVIRLYTLGKDEARVQEVEVQELIGFVTPVGSSEAAEEVKFAPEPQTGDAPGKTSLFVGRLPPGLVGKTVQVTINNIRIGTERFRVAFSNEKAAHDEGGMPAGVAGDEARALYLTPGGKYTEADIRANGNTTPQQKYRGVRSEHNAKPQPGDKVCPISLTKANPKFTWVVGGKTYEFCCIPCIDEFVLTARTRPDEIKDPAEYVKK